MSAHGASPRPSWSGSCSCVPRSPPPRAGRLGAGVRRLRLRRSPCPLAGSSWSGLRVRMTSADAGSAPGARRCPGSPELRGDRPRRKSPAVDLGAIAVGLRVRHLVEQELHLPGEIRGLRLEALHHALVVPLIRRVRPGFRLHASQLDGGVLGGRSGASRRDAASPLRARDSRRCSAELGRRCSRLSIPRSWPGAFVVRRTPCARRRQPRRTCR